MRRTSMGGRFCLWCATAIVAVLAVGCQGGSDRLPISGTVLDREGEPVEGSIAFLPDGPGEAPAANASVTGGDYRFDRTNGPVPGKYRVLVSPLVEKPEMGADGALAAPAVEPATFEVEVSADEPTLDFELP